MRFAFPVKLDDIWSRWEFPFDYKPNGILFSVHIQKKLPSTIIFLWIWRESEMIFFSESMQILLRDTSLRRDQLDPHQWYTDLLQRIKMHPHECHIMQLTHRNTRSLLHVPGSYPIFFLFVPKDVQWFETDAKNNPNFFNLCS